MLRVIAGSARGIPLRAPGGATRPTSARLRESLFSMLEAAGASFDEVLDLYAGSGALGIEALSRGEGRCTFVEADRRALAALRENLGRTRLAERASVAQSRVERWRPPAETRYTLVVADPPYDDAGAWEAVTQAIAHALDDGALVAIEHAARRTPPETLGELRLWRDRRQGDGAVALYAAPDADAGTPSSEPAAETAQTDGEEGR